MKKLSLHWQILIAITLAAIIGSLVKFDSLNGTVSNFLGISYISIFEYIGTLFLNALKMIIVPLIVSSIIVGVAGIGDAIDLKLIGIKTLIFYSMTTIFAILIGLFLINLISPGYIDNEPAGKLLALDSYQPNDLSANIQAKGINDAANVFIRMVPPNIFKAAAEGQMLGLIFFSILFGYFMTKLPSQLKISFFSFWDATFRVMMNMTEWIMKFAPVGVFGLVAAVIAKTGFSAVKPLAVFSLTVICALLLHAAVILPLLIRFIAKIDPIAVFKASSSAMLTAFSTASSSATLPISMRIAEKNIGISNKITSFVLPLGATVNMNGTALYECAAAMFLAQAYGLQLDLGVQFTIVIIALMTSIGVAGVPSASLVAIAIILGSIGLPIEAIGVLMVFDRVLDMFRTSVNVWGDIVCTAIISRLSGEQTNFGISENRVQK
jgi:Na+/H+-dicarboxylate symporter